MKIGMISSWNQIPKKGPGFKPLKNPLFDDINWIDTIFINGGFKLTKGFLIIFKPLFPADIFRFLKTELL